MIVFIPAIVIGVLLLGFNAYYLWEWWAHQLSGDVMIHLTFARNFAEGRWFEYGLDQSSRANTTILWEWILAVLGTITGQIRSHEGFMTVARIWAVLMTALTGWRLFHWGKYLGLTASVASVVAVFICLNPVTFYWTAVNPMETCMTMVFLIFSVEWLTRTSVKLGESDPSPREQMRLGLIGGLWLFALSLIRPELLTAGPIAALAFLFGQGWRRWPLGLTLILVPFLLTALQAVLLSLTGQPIIPTPTSARRMIALVYDTFPMPLTSIPWNPDAWKFMVVLAPLVAGCLFGAFLGERKYRPVHFFALGVFGFSCLFFSLYYYTTWQGRYMVPSFLLSIPLGVAIWCGVILPWLQGKLTALPWKRLLWGGSVAYGLVLCALLLRPLASYADAPMNRKDQTQFVPPPPGAETFLVQEVQCAYFHPELYIISTEGLITLETFHAYQKGQTLYEFILEYKPDLVGFGRYYLKDPDGLQQMINSHLMEEKDLQYKDLDFKFYGQMKGSGPFYKANWRE